MFGLCACCGLPSMQLAFDLSGQPRQYDSETAAAIHAATEAMASTAQREQAARLGLAVEESKLAKAAAASAAVARQRASEPIDDHERAPGSSQPAADAMPTDESESSRPAKRQALRPVMSRLNALRGAHDGLEAMELDEGELDGELDGAAVDAAPGRGVLGGAADRGGGPLVEEPTTERATEPATESEREGGTQLNSQLSPASHPDGITLLAHGREAGPLPPPKGKFIDLGRNGIERSRVDEGGH